MKCCCAFLGKHECALCMCIPVLSLVFPDTHIHARGFVDLREELLLILHTQQLRTETCDNQRQSSARQHFCDRWKIGRVLLLVVYLGRTTPSMSFHNAEITTTYQQSVCCEPSAQAARAASWDVSSVSKADWAASVEWAMPVADEGQQQRW